MAEEKSCPMCCGAAGKETHRDAEEVKRLVNRLNRVEGQVRGIRGMLEKDAYCVDILTQVMAVQAAMNAFSREILGNHIRTCVADGIRAGDDEVVDELVATVQKIMK
ncbi:MAG: metal-sensing transcriptional repressor [Clostridia bacterium]|nr:metal-sensing transcriptional repressor [Clostridia bacterium]